MKILLTGDTGFLGKQLKQCLPKTWQIIGLNRQVGELTNIDVVRQFVGEQQPDVIIHAAAMADVHRCEREREAAYQSHVILSEVIARVANEVGAQLVFISSDQVYDKFTPTIKTEQTQANPQTYYGELKLLAEKQLRALTPTAIILRLGWQSLADKTAPHGLYRLVANAIATQTPLRYHPQARQYPCDVRLSVKVIEAACLQQLAPGVYNVTQMTELTLGELFLAGFQTFGLTVEAAKQLLIADEGRENVQLCAQPQNLQRQGFEREVLIWECE